jgi:NAD(P)-dependent dehydrogenase (short-subunit alcohol dehydrogenase family)
MATPLAETKEGYESQFGTNHVGHALLTKLLLPTLLRTAEEPNADVRIVNLSSDGHNMAPSGGFVPDDAKLKSLGAWPRYGHSKLANILHAKGLAKRYPQITSVSLHPGFILTDLYSAHGSVILKYLTAAAEPVMFTPVKEGAYNQLWASTVPKDKLVNGGYYKPVGSKAGGSILTGYARDEKLADKLWAWTEEELKKHGY